MPHISIIPAMETSDPANNGAVTYIKNYLQQHHLASTEVLDFEHLNFGRQFGQPMAKPSREVKKLVRKIRSSEGILIVTPEFNGEYPNNLKNMIDFLYEEWNHKPVAISTVSDDFTNHSQIIKSLQFSLWKVNSWTLPVSFQVPDQIASRSTDLSIQSSVSHRMQPEQEAEFQQVFNNYCNKYIQLCTRVQYAV